MAAAKTKPKAFVKMYASGNDFVVLDLIGTTLQHPIKTARHMCDRKTGIGADQLLVLTKSRMRDADYRMQAFNPDGSEAEMCGNGIRCVAKYIFDQKLVKTKTARIETLGGVKVAQPMPKGNYSVDMGEPAIKGKEIGISLNGRVINRPLKMEGREFRITCCGMGNPHCVIFLDNPTDFPVKKFGPMIETYHAFPKRINVEFCEAVSRNEIVMRVWERGTGETDGCGTGACATVVAGVLNGRTDRDVLVKMPGGDVKVKWDRESNHIFLTGSAGFSFRGEFELP